ncbi:MAG: phage holin family protein [Cyclobacteriaceae bacterium]
MSLVIRLVLSALGVLIAAYILPGVNVDGFFAAIVVSIILGILNWTVKPLLILFTLPLTFLTLGLFLLVINALIILLANSIVPGFEVEGFWWALLFSLVLTVLNSFFQDISGEKRSS